MKLSVYIVTLNEEKRLFNTLNAASKVADEIIVVDSGSTDKTEEIAKKYGAKFIFHKWISYCDQKYFAQQECSNDFILMLDADEVLSDKLIDEINILKENKPNFFAYKIKIVDMISNHSRINFLTKSFNPIRLYNRKYATIEKNLMNKDRVNLEKKYNVGQLKNIICHYSFISIEESVKKYNIHSSELVKTAIKNNVHYSRFRLFIEFPRQFFKYYFIQGFFMYGKNGFIQAMILSYFRFLKIAKWVEYNEINKNKDKK